MKWFYHAAETEGTAKGGGRVEDIKTPVGELFVLLYVEDIRTPISLFNCVCFPCVCVHSNVFIFISRTSILWWLQLCVFLFSFVCNCLGDIFVVLFIFVFVFSCMFVSDKSSISLRILFVCLFLCLLSVSTFAFFESVDTRLIVDVAVFLFLPISKLNGFVWIVSSGLIGASE